MCSLDREHVPMTPAEEYGEPARFADFLPKSFVEFVQDLDTTERTLLAFGPVLVGSIGVVAAWLSVVLS